MKKIKTFSKKPAQNESLKTISCPICQGRDFQNHWEMEDFFFVICKGCSLLLQNPQPIREDLAARYDKEYFDYEIDNEENFFHLMMLALKDLAFFEKIAATLPKTNRILDVGCATGRLLKHFKALGWETRGAELCDESAHYGNQEYGVNIVKDSLERAAFPDAFFSVVHASHLIEHVDNPANFVDEVFRTLLPGGVFICITPSSDGLQAKITGDRWRSAIADHVTLFDKKNLRRLLKNAGFVVETTCSWGGLAEGMAPFWLKSPIDFLAKVFNFGDVVLMLARKPF